MKPIGRVLNRTQKGEFGPRKKPLPQTLSFLSGVPFYAVTECLLPNSDTRQTRIEILPSSLKKITKSNREYVELKQEHDEVVSTLKNAKSLFLEQYGYMQELEKANEQLIINLGKGPDTPESKIKSYLQKAEEIGFISRGLPLQGGLPSLGKNR